MQNTYIHAHAYLHVFMTAGAHFTSLTCLSLSNMTIPIPLNSWGVMLVSMCLCVVVCKCMHMMYQCTRPYYFEFLRWNDDKCVCKCVRGRVQLCTWTCVHVWRHVSPSPNPSSVEVVIPVTRYCMSNKNALTFTNQRRWEASGFGTIPWYPGAWRKFTIFCMHMCCACVHHFHENLFATTSGIRTRGMEHVCESYPCLHVHIHWCIHMLGCERAHIYVHALTHVYMHIQQM